MDSSFNLVRSVRKMNQFVDPKRRLLEDWDENEYEPKYPAAHLYFTDDVPEELFKKIKKNSWLSNPRYIKTFMEANYAFVPLDNRVFHLNQSETVRQIYQPHPAGSKSKLKILERYADQLATVCVNLNEFPAVRYQSNSENAKSVAEILQDELKSSKSDIPGLGEPLPGEGSGKGQSQLIVLDRDFDPIAPIIHETTYQGKFRLSYAIIVAYIDNGD